MDYENERLKNIAETLADVLPKPSVLAAAAVPEGVQGLSISHMAVPKNMDLKEVRVDLEALLPSPRQTKAKANFTDTASFLAYVARHADERSLVWCQFNPQTFALAFTAVFDEHVKGKAGWRSHVAYLQPDFSHEWKAWKGSNGNSFDQVPFAEWIQEHEDDIAAANGLPTSLQMLEMATNFVMNEERSLKSAIKLQSGGVRLTYVADPEKGTTESMQLFERFALGIPVFQGGSAWSIGARLKYRTNGGKVKFLYELVRPDRVHKGAAEEVIEAVRTGLNGVPMVMGSCS